MAHEKFHYKTLEEVRNRAEELGVRLPFAENTGALILTWARPASRAMGLNGRMIFCIIGRQRRLTPCHKWCKIGLFQTNKKDGGP